MIYLISALAAGLLIGVAWPPATSTQNKSSKVEWSLPGPDTITRHNPRDMSVVTGKVRWGNEAKAGGDKAATPGSWRLVGILRDSGLTALVMPADATTEATRASIGDILPDGSKLVAIKGDTVITENHSCRTTYQMFLPAPVNQSDGCAQTDVSSQ
ncbi:MAG: hypothetical protein ABI268_02055 [Rhodanobacter sp.]